MHLQELKSKSPAYLLKYAEELEIENEKIAIKKYGKGGTSSGQILGDILGKAFGSKKNKKKEDKK